MIIFAMKKFFYIIAAVFALGVVSSCDEEENSWDQYADWRNANDTWLKEQESVRDANGDLFYTKVVPAWNKDAYVLIHYFNDRKATEGNLTPLYTSTVDVKYYGRLYNDEPFDSSYNRTAAYGDSIFRTLVSEVVSGWAIALEAMKVGDSVRVVIPYQQGYGSVSKGSVPPYSCMQFDMKLVDIPYYEIKDPE